MASFSASPAPRRSMRMRPVPTSPQRRLAAASRLGTPMNASDYESGSMRASVYSSMDVDEEESVVSEMMTPMQQTSMCFAKSDQLSASFYSDLPVEVMQVLKNADFYGGAYTGDIDTATGFALVASAEACFVWQHVQAVKGIPTCYIFACPRDYDQTASPLHGLIPYSSSREPGLILISPSGQIRVWDSISIGLAGGDHFSASTLPLASDEYVTNLERVDSQTFIASTSSGSLYRLMLVPLGGKLQLTAHSFARPSSALSLTRIYSSFFAQNTSSVVSEPGNVNAVAVGQSTADGGKDVWALVDTRIQKWELKAEGWEDLLVDEELLELFAKTLRRGLAIVEPSRLDLELLDIAVNSSGMLVVLLSFSDSENPNAMTINATRRYYAIVHLRNLGVTFNVEACHRVPYQSTSSSGAPMHPRLQLILGGEIISVQFGDAIALVSTRSEYKDRLELKSNNDRTLGVGIFNAESAILVLTSGIMLKAFIDSNNIRDVNLETGTINLIKSIMTQAVLYGPIPQNPLTFSFPPEVDEESLMQGAQQLSDSILESDPLLVLRNNDLHSQMTSRKERLGFLIQFINDNSVLRKLSQTCRQKLAVDAEKLYAAYQLWLQHNDLLSAGKDFSVLHETVYTFMCAIQEGHHEDVMRAFFKLRISDLGMVTVRVAETLMRSVNGGQNLAVLLPEANSIVLCVLRSSFDYRDYNKAVYGLSLPMINPWTGDVAIIEVVRGLFEQTTREIEEPMPGRHDAELRAQLPELASVLFASLHERLDWVESAAKNEESGARAELIELRKKIVLLRPTVLETLRRNGHNGSAFSLAERYQDFASLAALCNKEVVYPPKDNPNIARIQNYLDRFNDKFATELYRWYIQHGELRVLFAQDEMHIGYMDRFFAENSNPAISWIHDLGLQRYESASMALHTESLEASVLAEKRFMLSLGKLTHLAHTQDAPIPVQRVDKVLETFHDDLDFVSVQTEVREDFATVLESLRGRQSLDSQANAVLKAKASVLADRIALSSVFKGFVRTLLQGKVLAVEDAVDVLSLKDNNESHEAFATALKLLIRAHSIPDARRTSAFRSVWRRVYLHDDWPTLQRTGHVPDSELNDRFRNTALYATFAIMTREGYQLEEYAADPQVALIPPTVDEIGSRWPGMPAEDIESVLTDYLSEVDGLGELDLDDVYDKVQMLVEEDILDPET